MAVGVILDLLVLALLACALALGLRLNGRLKALRDGQADFARAVGELNDAARRAEAGLAELRRGAEETLERLEGGIAAARGLVEELERASLRRPPVSALRADPRPERGGAGDERPRTSRPPGEAGGLSAAQGATGGQAHLAAGAPEGFAAMVRRTLRKGR